MGLLAVPPVLRLLARELKPESWSECRRVAGMRLARRALEPACRRLTPRLRLAASGHDGWNRKGIPPHPRSAYYMPARHEPDSQVIYLNPAAWTCWFLQRHRRALSALLIICFCPALVHASAPAPADPVYRQRVESDWASQEKRWGRTPQDTAALRAALTRLAGPDRRSRQWVRLHRPFVVSG